MPDDFDALRSIRQPLGELDADRAARMRARALASVFAEAGGDPSLDGGSVLTEAPERAGRSDRDRRDHRSPRDRPDLVLRSVPTGPTTEIHLDRPGDHAPAPRTARNAGRRPFLVVAAAAAVVLAVIGFGLVRAGDRSDVVADQPRPTSVSGIAANAATVVDRPVAPGEYSYLAIEDGQPFTDVDGTPETHVKVRETWTSTTGDGRDRWSDTSIIDGSGQPAGTFDVATDSGHVADAPGFGSFGYAELRSLPTDPAELRTVLENGTYGHPTAYNRSHLLGQLLALDATPPAVRAAALTILAEDGATVVDDAADHDGRRGLGIVVDRPDGFTSVYVVTRDGQLIGAYDIVTGDTLDPDRAVDWYTVRDQRRVATTD